MTYYVYILANRSRGVLYIGSTSDLYRRMEQHKKRVVPSFADEYGILTLVYVEGYPSILEARARESVLNAGAELGNSSLSRNLILLGPICRINCCYDRPSAMLVE